MLGLYYREINFNMGVMLGIIGFACAVVGGLGSLIGPIIGGSQHRRACRPSSPSCCPSPAPTRRRGLLAVIIALIGLFPTGRREIQRAGVR